MEATGAAQRAGRDRERRLRARDDRRQKREGRSWDDDEPMDVALVACTTCRAEVAETLVSYGPNGATCGACFSAVLDARAQQATFQRDAAALAMPLFLVGVALAAPALAKADLGVVGWAAVALSVVGSSALSLYSVHAMRQARTARRLAAEGIGPAAHPASWGLRALLMLVAPVPALLGVLAALLIAA